MRLIDADRLLDSFQLHCGQKDCDNCKLLDKEHCKTYKTIESAWTVENFSVDTIVKQLQYGETFWLIGASSGIKLYDSSRNTKTRYEKYKNCLSSGVFTSFQLGKSHFIDSLTEWVRPVICIFVLGE